MSSSMLTGDRRWGATRRGGMTVLGKVAVPKPINLPSQRLENHGLDPTVEIVPKGTAGWGNRSTTSNAWGSATVSPSTDGGSGSPSHLSGRPSSGGSGTRPSTAGSDRASESTSSAWGPSSRPSSASGPLTSNQSSLASLRPRSAETRPGSSQLSRFAEPLSENQGVWGAASTSEKLGVVSSKRDGFSLTSGDFPTLGSEKDNSGKNNEFQEPSPHARPGSSSGKVAPVKERTGASPVGDASVNDVKSGTVNTWKRESPYVEDGPRPNVEKWRGESQPYLNASIPPQHFEPWHGTPPPGGVWFRGPPGHPFGAPVAPAGFPMEAFPYYRPQIPATALANSQPVPPQGPGPRGPHPKNGDMYRPHIPDAYIRPGMPIRPGFYPGPVPYEGYYPPPMGYCNSNERDIPFMGMPAGHPVYERYSNQNPRDSNNSHSRTGGYVSSGKPAVPEQVESGHPHDNIGPYRVLLKHHNDWDGKDEQKWDPSGTTNASDLEKGDHRNTSWDDDWEVDPKKTEELDSRRIKVGGEAASQSFDSQTGSASVKVKLIECVGAIDDSVSKKFDTAPSTSSEAPKPSVVSQKDSTLIQKIEGLNAKARASDGRHDGPFVPIREEKKNSFQVETTKINQSTKEAGSSSTYSERIQADAVPIPASPASREVGVSTGLESKDRSSEQVPASGAAISRRATHGAQGRVDHRGKGMSNAQDVDGWRKKSLGADSTGVSGSSNVDQSSNAHVQDCHSSMQAPQKTGLHLQGTEDGESGIISEPIDGHAQRAKMIEIAKQRAIQRQKEEEERTREQKAKARAKLEELDRRTQTVEGSSQKLVDVQSSDTFQHKQELQVFAEPNVDAGKIAASSLALVSSSSVTTQFHEDSASKVGDAADLPGELPKETSRRSNEESVIPNQSVPLQQNASGIDAADSRSSSQMNDGNVSKQKRVGYKQRQNIHKQNVPVEKNLTEKSVSTVTMEMPKSHSDVVVGTAAAVELAVNEMATNGGVNLPVNANVTMESSGNQRRKNSRSSKNKLKLEDALLPKETNPGKASVENVMPKVSEIELDPGLTESISNPKDATQSSENRGSLPNEEVHGRPTNQWKPRPRRTPRNLQVNRPLEKFHNSDSVIWAPVRQQNKSEVDEVSEKTVIEPVNTSSRGDLQAQNNLKNKRAEMERYVVPKPVAKELAQQGSTQRPTSPSINQTPDDTSGRAGSGSQSTDSAQLGGTAAEKSGVVMESRNNDPKPNRQAKSSLWRQRVPTESTHVQCLHEESSYTSNPGKNVQKSAEHSETLKPERQSVKSQPKYADDWSTPDGWNTLESSDSAPPVPSAVVKDQGVSGRGKGHPFKGQKGMGSTHGLDYKNAGGGNTNKMPIESPPLEMGQTDTTVASKENRGAGERSSSHWQPKSQAYPVHNQRGGRHNSSQNANAEVARTIRKESTSHGGGAHFPPHHDKETYHPRTDQPASETGTVLEDPTPGHQETKGEEKNVASLKGRPHSPNQAPVNSVEPVPAGTDIRNEQRSSTGFRKNGNHSNRFTRGGHESRGDWSSGGQDNRQHNQPQNRERQRYNSHYEYQPVGPLNNKRSNFEGASDGSHNTSLRFRERGPGHSRRGGGNFYDRQSGNARVDASYD